MKFNLPETLMKPSPFVCPFDISLRKKNSVFPTLPLVAKSSWAGVTSIAEGRGSEGKARPSKPQPDTAAPEVF